jgi:hypothetical protein
VFREKLDFAVLDPENVLLEVDACLVGFQHVQAEQEVDLAALADKNFNK